MAGPIIRLPLRERAARLAYLGLAVCVVAVFWFLFAFPQGWTRSAYAPVIGLYALGTIAIGIGGVFIPLLTPTATTTAETDLTAEVERLREDVAGAEADEADLAARLRSLRSSSARFELYEDQGGEYRWRLRHRKGNTLADSGQGYAERRNAREGVESVKRNAPSATLGAVARREKARGISTTHNDQSHCLPVIAVNVDGDHR
ncbi:MAG: YegP family protein [Halobellus sp.]